ncbi:BapA prefix-like domain-containing protein [bacterium]|nr:BapA prefix-like domain-containing protein [bacterium]
MALLTVTERNGLEVSSQEASVVDLPEVRGTDVQLGVSRDEIDAVVRSGDDLIVTLENGEVITLEDYFALPADELPHRLFTEENGGYFELGLTPGGSAAAGTAAAASGISGLGVLAGLGGLAAIAAAASGGGSGSGLGTDDGGQSNQDFDDLKEGTPENDTLDGDIGNDTISGFEGDDVLIGGLGDDIVNGGDNNDDITGNEGQDTLSGDAGDDTISGGDDNDLISGGPGNDDLSGDAGNDTIFGNEGDDVISGGAGDDSIDGGENNDDITGNEGADTLSGDAGDDTISGGDDNDLISGGQGVDDLSGDAGNDTIFGNEDNDTLSGGAGDDLLDGGNDSDTFIIENGPGNDTIIGGEDGKDIDIIDLTAVTDPYTVDFTGPESGTITIGDDVIEFEQIESILSVDQVKTPVDFTNLQGVAEGEDAVLGSYELNGEAFDVTMTVNDNQIGEYLAGDANGNIVLGDNVVDVPDGDGSKITLDFGDVLTPVTITTPQPGEFRKVFNGVDANAGDRVVLEAAGGFTVNDPDGQLMIISNDGDVLVIQPVDDYRSDSHKDGTAATFTIETNEPVSSISIEGDGDRFVPLNIAFEADELTELTSDVPEAEPVEDAAPVSTLDFSLIEGADPSELDNIELTDDADAVLVDLAEEMVALDTKPEVLDLGVVEESEPKTEDSKGNNGFGNGDQNAPGGSEDNNGAENGGLNVSSTFIEDDFDVVI